VGISLSDALGRVTLFGERSERSRLPATEAQCSIYSAGARVGIWNYFLQIPHSFEL